MEVDLERAVCLHWHVHGDIHGVSVMKTDPIDIFQTDDVEHLQLSPV